MSVSSQTLRHKNYTPKYIGLAQALLRQIACEGLSPGDRLGTEIEMGQEHKVSRVTVRQALSLLEEEGYISRQKARGTFVTRAVENFQQLSPARGSVLVACSNEQAAQVDEDFAFATVLREMERTLARQGFSVQIIGVGEDKVADQARLQLLASRDDLEGVCTIGPCLDPYRDIFKKVPVISSCCFYGEGAPLVRQDVMEVSLECVGYLLARGHREIAMIAGPWVDQKAFGIYAEGYRRAYEKAGLRYRRGHLCHAYPGESLESLVDSALASPTAATAVFATDWRVAQVVLSLADKQQLQIGKELSLISYGQNVLQLPSNVPITTYVPDSRRIGEIAAELLAQSVDGAKPPSEPISVTGQLLVRGSVRELSAATPANEGSP